MEAQMCELDMTESISTVELSLKTWIKLLISCIMFTIAMSVRNFKALTFWVCGLSLVGNLSENIHICVSKMKENLTGLSNDRIFNPFNLSNFIFFPQTDKLSHQTVKDTCFHRSLIQSQIFSLFFFTHYDVAHR